MASAAALDRIHRHVGTPQHALDTFPGERLTAIRQYDGTRIEPGTSVQLGWRAEDAFEINPSPQTHDHQEVR